MPNKINQIAMDDICTKPRHPFRRMRLVSLRAANAIEHLKKLI
jgi:hypothetical protein